MGVVVWLKALGGLMPLARSSGRNPADGVGGHSRVQAFQPRRPPSFFRAVGCSEGSAVHGPFAFAENFPPPNECGGPERLPRRVPPSPVKNARKQQMITTREQCNARLKRLADGRDVVFTWGEFIRITDC